MRIGRLILLAGAGLAGYMTYKVVEVSTRPLPCEPLRTVRVPPEPVEAFASMATRRFPDDPERAQRMVEQFARVLRRRLNTSADIA